MQKCPSHTYKKKSGQTRNEQRTSLQSKQSFQNLEREEGTFWDTRLLLTRDRSHQAPQKQVERWSLRFDRLLEAECRLTPVWSSSGQWWGRRESYPLPRTPPGSHSKAWWKSRENSRCGLGVLSQEPLRNLLRSLSLKEQKVSFVGGRTRSEHAGEIPLQLEAGIPLSPSPYLAVFLCVEKGLKAVDCRHWRTPPAAEGRGEGLCPWVRGRSTLKANPQPSDEGPMCIPKTEDQNIWEPILPQHAKKPPGVNNSGFQQEELLETGSVWGTIEREPLKSRVGGSPEEVLSF